MNAHQRRVTERARDLDRFKAVRAPRPEGDFIAIGTNFAKLADPLRNLQLPKDLPPGVYSANIVGGKVEIKNVPQGVETDSQLAERVLLDESHKPSMKAEARKQTRAMTDEQLKRVHISTHELGFVFVKGASVRNTRTKSVATMIEDHSDQFNSAILVHRRDNRKVEWPLDECENWF
jgi:hypothetical protein